jgi:ribosomal protein L11 methyltransferase
LVIWRLISITVDVEAQEILGCLLFDLGATGLITLEEAAGCVTLGAYYPEQADPRYITRAVRSAFEAGGRLSALHGIDVTSVPDEDWMQKWKEGFEPTEIGRRLLVSPSWQVPVQPGSRKGPRTPSRIIIQIDPGMAFGTGTHETTKMCLEALERYWKGGRLLDVGTGTGILGIAAAKLVPKSKVTMIDVDPQAVQIAIENAAINGVSDSVRIKQGQAHDQARGAFDVVVANLTAEVIIDMMADLAGCLASGGCLVLSGILADLAGDVERALGEPGLSVIEKKVTGEWTAVVGH